MEVLAELEKVQTQILRRIRELELSHLSQDSSASLSDSLDADDRMVSTTASSATVERLSAILRANSVGDFTFKKVPLDYYDCSLEARRDLLGAASVHHLCKSIVLVNTQAQSHVTDCSDHSNSKYYVVVVQYTARFSAEMVKNFLYLLNDGVIPKKKFNLRLAPEETSAALTGYEHNGVTCIGMKTDIPVILDEAIVKLSPDFFCYLKQRSAYDGSYEMSSNSSDLVSLLSCVLVQDR
ncbi:hypothetical protein Nepgr_028484 [Nepenthes gracilis]|uniref:YbaK/aminoacyl-tRNA synthetase-associated domain-containing protein n=1 Tax=Nepenthes gracilis TaxID=150966 RepID=A0AAD3Y4L2_NEPGR|nr:hypothetical protein Nepgr_028484 [Nepenthes gracilis]